MKGYKEIDRENALLQKKMDANTARKELAEKSQKAQKAQTVRMNYQAEKNQRKIIQVAKFKLNPRN